MGGSVFAMGNNPSKERLLDVKICKLNKTIKHESEYVTKIGPSSIKEAVVIDGVENNLYPTFDDIDISLKELEKAIPHYYQFVRERVDLKELYNSDYETVLETDVFPENDELKALYEKIKNSSINIQGAMKSAALSQEEIALLNEEETFEHFYDIFENKAENEEIKAYLAKHLNPDKETLAMLLPYTSPFAKEYLATANNTLSNTSQYFDRAKGVDYAIQYAENYNPMYAYFWIGGDCTNFASQILLAGGVKMHDEMWPDTEQGWWYRGAELIEQIVRYHGKMQIGL